MTLLGKEKSQMETDFWKVTFDRENTKYLYNLITLTENFQIQLMFNLIYFKLFGVV